jgi:tetratricopeptide (TPR) repeat protein
VRLVCSAVWAPVLALSATFAAAATEPDPGEAEPARWGRGGAGFWEQVADPDGAVVDGLVARARAELDRGVPGGPAPEGAARAEAMLAEALRRKPRHFRAAFLRGDALTLQGHPAEAIAAIAGACNLAESAEDESACTLRLAVEQSRAGRFGDALATYDRHLRSEEAQPIAYTNSAEILMALGRLGEAAGRYREAIRLEEAAAPGRQRDEELALALYGLAVALDRDEQAGAAREAIGRATYLDPRLRLLETGGNSDSFFVPAGDVHYYRGLALRTLERPEEAREAFRRFLREAPSSGFVRAAQAHLRALESSGREEGAASPAAGASIPPADALVGRSDPPRARFKVVAAATVSAEGPLPAPLIDAALRGQGRALEGCFADLPLVGGSTVRLRLDLAVDARGGLRRVTAPEPPAGWAQVPVCLEERLKQAVRFPRPARAATTHARLEVLLRVAPAAGAAAAPARKPS